MNYADCDMSQLSGPSNQTWFLRMLETKKDQNYLPANYSAKCATNSFEYMNVIGRSLIEMLGGRAPTRVQGLVFS